MVHGRPVLGLLAYQLDHLWFGDVEERRDYQVGRNRCLNLPLSVGHDAHVDHAVNEPELPSDPVVLEGSALVESRDQAVEGGEVRHGCYSHTGTHLDPTGYDDVGAQILAVETSHQRRYGGREGRCGRGLGGLRHNQLPFRLITRATYPGPDDYRDYHRQNDQRSADANPQHVVLTPLRHRSRPWLRRRDERRP